MASSFQIETQERLNWCWAAVAATVSHYFFPTLSTTQCTIAKQVLQPPGGDCCSDGLISPCDQAAELETALSAVNTLTGQSLNDQTLSGKIITFGAVRQQIDSGRPVCARIQWFGEQRGHFVMISGYSLGQSGEQWVDIADPYYDDSILPYDQFVSAYLDAGEWSDTYLVGQQ